ncbi:tyrosine-protein phosphatase [Pseudonocardia nematodicida]|uniref:Tyrosine-protein phosphatase n=1 Tax=Pseudonocardia nematodicida TaxID=1206997 RepID=A0ABV1KDL8_9PSEU
MTDLARDRWLTFDGLANARDVGGLPLAGGGSLRTGVLIRTESLEGLSPADVARLTGEYGVVQVLDLRKDDELAMYGAGALAEAGVVVHRLSFIPEEGREIAALPELGDDADPMVGHYLAYLGHRAANVVEGVRRVAELDEGATVVHCAAGKDRTGVLVALIASAAGVPRDEVVADYALSATRITALFRRWTTAAGQPMPPPEEIDRHRPRAEVMAAFLRLLDERHGGPVGWLREHGLTDDELARLSARLRDGDAA